MINLKDNESFTLSYMHYDKDQYNALYFEKVHKLVKSIVNFEDWKVFFHQQVSNEIEQLESSEIRKDNSIYENCSGALTLIPSPPTNCRERVRFGIQTNPHNERISYVMWEGGSPIVYIEEFPIASSTICILMRPLIDYLNDCVHLSNGLKAVHFLSSTLGEVVISLIYDRDIDSPESIWLSNATMLKDYLLVKISVLESSVSKINLIGRSKKKKVVIGCNYVLEHLVLPLDGRTLLYKQVDDGFSNPNARVNMKALDWICFSVREEILKSNHVLDLLEMYCGNGNHTVALSAYFRKILAVEINKALCDAAVENLQFNNIRNVSVVACDSSKFANRILGHTTYKYYHIKNSGVQNSESKNSHEILDSAFEEFQFSAVLVDPPRCGLDSKTIKAIQQYDYIIYISCNPSRLFENMIQLSTSHEILRMATFDHFAYTPHLEVGVLLKKKQN